MPAGNERSTAADARAAWTSVTFMAARENESVNRLVITGARESESRGRSTRASATARFEVFEQTRTSESRVTKQSGKESDRGDGKKKSSSTQNTTRHETTQRKTNEKERDGGDGREVL